MQIAAVITKLRSKQEHQDKANWVVAFNDKEQASEFQQLLEALIKAFPLHSDQDEKLAIIPTNTTKQVSIIISGKISQHCLKLLLQIREEEFTKDLCIDEIIKLIKSTVATNELVNQFINKKDPFNQQEYITFHNFLDKQSASIITLNPTQQQISLQELDDKFVVDEEGNLYGKTSAESWKKLKRNKFIGFYSNKESILYTPSAWLKKENISEEHFVRRLHQQLLGSYYQPLKKAFKQQKPKEILIFLEQNIVDKQALTDLGIFDYAATLDKKNEDNSKSWLKWFKANLQSKLTVTQLKQSYKQLIIAINEEQEHKIIFELLAKIGTQRLIQLRNADASADNYKQNYFDLADIVIDVCLSCNLLTEPTETKQTDILKFTEINQKFPSHLLSLKSHSNAYPLFALLFAAALAKNSVKEKTDTLKSLLEQLLVLDSKQPLKNIIQRNLPLFKDTDALLNIIINFQQPLLTTLLQWLQDNWPDKQICFWIDLMNCKAPTELYHLLSGLDEKTFDNVLNHQFFKQQLSIIIKNDDDLYTFITGLNEKQLLKFLSTAVATERFKAVIQNVEQLKRYFNDLVLLNREPPFLALPSIKQITQDYFPDITLKLTDFVQSLTYQWLFLESPIGKSLIQYTLKNNKDALNNLAQQVIATPIDLACFINALPDTCLNLYTFLYVLQGTDIMEKVLIDLDSIELFLKRLDPSTDHVGHLIIITNRFLLKTKVTNDDLILNIVLPPGKLRQKIRQQRLDDAFQVFQQHKEKTDLSNQALSALLTAHEAIKHTTLNHFVYSIVSMHNFDPREHAENIIIYFAEKMSGKKQLPALTKEREKNFDEAIIYFINEHRSQRIYYAILITIGLAAIALLSIVVLASPAVGLGFTLSSATVTAFGWYLNIGIAFATTALAGTFIGGAIGTLGLGLFDANKLCETSKTFAEAKKLVAEETPNLIPTLAK